MIMLMVMLMMLIADGNDKGRSQRKGAKDNDNHMTMMIQYLPRCDCDSLAADPDSFCSNGDVCKVSRITILMVVELIFVVMMIMIVMIFSSFCRFCFNILQDCVCGPRFPPGCECDPYSNDPGESYSRITSVIES